MITNPRAAARILGSTASILMMPLLSSIATTNPSFVGITSPALADVPATTRRVRYSPPKRGIPKQTQGTGSRGCPESSTVASLNLLVPSDHIGQTVSGHPTFFWHLSKPTPMRVEFALVEPGVAKPLFVQQLELNKAGTVKMTLPKHVPELVSGRKYRWSVSMVCNSNRRSSDVFIQSWVQRVPMTRALTTQLAAVGNDRDRASVYAQSGLWYDALAAISTAETNNLSDSSLREARLSLLDQVGLTQVSEQERQHIARN